MGKPLKSENLPDKGHRNKQPSTLSGEGDGEKVV